MNILIIIDMLCLGIVKWSKTGYSVFIYLNCVVMCMVVPVYESDGNLYCYFQRSTWFFFPRRGLYIYITNILLY
jgi:hypothetical protein